MRALVLASLLALASSACGNDATSDAGGGSGGAGSGAAGARSDGGGAAAGGAAAGGAGGAATGRAATGGAAVSAGCEEVLNQAGLDTGLESCDDGTTRRRAALDCPTERTSPTSPCSPFTPTACSADADCTREPNGYCADAHRLTGYCGCYYGCRRDSDCEPGSLCECGVVVGRCVPAECTTNADCDAGLGCVATAEGSAGTACNSIGSGRASLYACQSASDECAGDAECPSSGNDPGVCVLDGDRRACGTVCAMTP